jgi:hypothetical protein
MDQFFNIIYAQTNKLTIKIFTIESVTQYVYYCDGAITCLRLNPEMYFRSVRMSDTIRDMKAYTLLTDDVIHRILESNDDGLRKSKGILQKILKRDLYSFVGEKIFPGGTFVRKVCIK